MMDGKVVTVTGAAMGIGRESALAFAAAGAKVVVADVNEDEGNGTVEEIRSRGGEAAFVRTDVTSERDAQAMVAFAVDTFGGLHCSHNNAGGAPGGRAREPLHELSEADWDFMVDLNLKGVWLCMKYELAHMREHGGGAIVNTGSSAAYRASLTPTWYTAAKHGVAGLTKGAAIEYAKQGIRINAVCPGVTETPLTVGMRGLDGVRELADRLNPTGQVIQPSEIAQAAVWLCSEGASAITGAIVATDAGQSAV